MALLETIRADFSVAERGNGCCVPRSDWQYHRFKLEI